MQTSKFCPTCATVKQTKEFGADKSRGDGLQSQCRVCKKTIQNKWYEKNKARHVASVVRRRKEVEAKIIREILIYLETHVCIDCGETNPVVLEFDHVRGHKVNAICNLIRRGCCWQTIYAEIQKCEVRCCNCHRIKTARQYGYRKMLMASAT